jgi:endonuclease/exonuclease/phosphatase family metal-dependent hydrolase
MKLLKLPFKLIGSLLSLAVLVIAGYVIYVVANYHRIDDNVLLTVENSQTQKISLNEQYNAITYNLGFGAYDPEFSFFMDDAVLRENVEGVGTAGQSIKGQSSVATSSSSVQELTQRALETVKTSFYTTPALILFQEIDLNAHRSRRVNQVEAAQTYFSNWTSVYASNFHSVWLQYPPFNPIGDIESGIVTLSPYAMTSATRRSLPVTDAFPTKFFDLDRCLTVARFPIENETERELVVINVHFSAYDSNGEFKKQQLELLYQLMNEEYAKGNFVMAGGDFNQAFGTSLTHFQNAEQVPNWIIEFDKTNVPAGFELVVPGNSEKVASVRDSSFSYIKGKNYETIVDGWLVSENIEAWSEVLDTGYQYSDHNPVQLYFTLAPIRAPIVGPNGTQNG